MILTGPSALQRAESALNIADHHLAEYNRIPFNQEDPAMMALEGVVKSLREAVGALTEHAQAEALRAQLTRSQEREQLAFPAGQTASEQPHPLAVVSIAADALRLNEVLGGSFAGLLRDMEAASHIADGVAMDVRENLASLPEATIEFSGTFMDSAGLDVLLAAVPPMHDLIFTPDEADRPECPHCHEAADELRYEGAQLEASTVREDDMNMQTLRSKSVRAARFLPCGHRFDGITGELIEADDAD